MASPATVERKARTKALVLEVATKVFAAEGFHGADVQVIADQAGVGKGTVYRTFGPKEQLFLAAARHALDEVGRSIDEGMGKSRGVADYLRSIALGCARYYSTHPEAVELIVQERALFRDTINPTHLLRHAEGGQGIEAELRRGIECGELRAVDVRATYESFGDMIFGTVVNGVLSGESRNLVRRIGHAMDVFLKGIVREGSD